ELETIRILPMDYAEVAPHIYIVRVLDGRRDAFMDVLKARGVGTGIHYIANHLQPFFKQYVTTDLPRASALWQQIVTIPLYHDMTDAQVETVVAAVHAFEHEYRSATRMAVPVYEGAAAV